MVRKIDESKQNLIINGLIVSDEFCKNIIPVLDYDRRLTNEVFGSFYKIVLGWCIKYFKKYNESPKRNITGVFKESYDNSEFSEEEYNLISKYLENLSSLERKKKFNEEYTVDQALIFLRKANLNLLKTTISEASNVEEAEKAVEDFNYIKRNTETLDDFDLFCNLDEEIQDTFDESKDNLFRLKGPLGEEVGYFQRGDLISFTAPAKRGKSWALQEIAVCALLHGLKVVFFSFEMSKKQVKKRLYKALVSEVSYIPKGEESVEIKIPVFRYNEDECKYEIKYIKKRKFGLTPSKIKRKIESLKIHTRGGGLKIVCPPAYSMTVKDSVKILDKYALEGFPADLIVYDYADIMKPDFKGEYRHQIDAIWKGLKGVAQEKHCVVATGSQSNKITFDKDIGQGDVSEDGRKINHTSFMGAINQTPDEKKKCISRISIMANRHEGFNSKDSFVITQCFKIGKFMLSNKKEADILKNVNKDRKKR